MAESKGSWELNGTNLELKVNGTVVAKIATSYLSVTEDDISEGQITGIEVTGEGTTADPYVIKLSKDVLAEKTAKLTTVKGYSAKFALDDDAKIQFSDFAWDEDAPANGKAILKATLSTGYTLKSNTEINYSKEEQTDKALATISGLTKNYTEGITWSEGDETIVLSREALGTGKVTISLSNGGNYKLDLDDDAKAHENLDKWAVSGNNATYKNVTPEYYSISTKGEVIYNKEVDVKVYAALTGVASGLKVSENGQFLYAGDTEDEEKAAIYFDAANNKLIHLTRDALTTKNVAFNTKAKLLVDDHLDYSLTFGAGGENYAATIVADSDSWTVSKGTATYKAKLTAGYSLALGNRSVTYTAAVTKNPTEIAKITGLNKSLTTDNYSEALSITNNTISDDSDDKIAEGTITLEAGAFTNANVTVTKGNYTLILGESVATKDTSDNTENLFSYSSKDGTATYDEYTKDHYDLSDTAKVAVYTAYGKTATLATFDGLSKNLELSAETEDETGRVIKGKSIIVKKTTADNDDITAVSVDDSNKEFTLNEEALDDKTIKITSTDYEIADIEDTEIEQPKDSYEWQVINEVAYLKQIKTEGYTLSTNGKTLTYSEKKYGNTVATLNGIKKGLEIGTVGEGDDAVTALGTYYIDEDGEKQFKPLVTVDLDKKKINLKKDALNKKGVTVTGSEVVNGVTTRYQLELEDITDYSTPLTANDNQTAWKVSNNNAALVKYTPASWSLVPTKGSGKNPPIYYYSISYKEANVGDTLATIKGLASGLKADDDGQLDGIKVDGDTITLSNSVLNKGDITIENKTVGEGATEYKLALDTAEDSTDRVTELLTRTATATYNKSKKTLTYTEAFTTGYQETSDGNIIYRAKSTDTTTITNVTEDWANTIKSEVDSDDQPSIFALTENDIEKDKNDKPLDAKLTLKGKYNTGYKLDFTGNITENLVWKKTAKDTKATYNVVTEGYALSGDGMSVNYSSASKPVVKLTISGLKKDVPLDENGYICEVNSDGNLVPTEEKGVEFSEDGKTIKVNKDLLGDGNVTLGKKDDYSLAIDVEDCKAKDETSLLEFNASKGTLTISKGTTKGWRINESDPKTIAYEKPKLTTLATITGLPKTFKVSKTNDQQLLDADGNVVLTVTAPTDTKSGVIKVTQALFDAGTDVVVKETSKGADDAILGVKKLAIGAKNNYVFELDDVDVPDYEDETPTWTANKGTLTYVVEKDDGYTPSTDGKTITYTAKNPTAALATIKGLSSKIKDEPDSDKGEVATDDVVSIDENNVITLKADALTGVTKEVKLTGDGYTLALYEGDSEVEDDSDIVPQPTPRPEPIWSIKGTTATLKEGTTAGYSVANGGKSITYTAAQEGDTVATITGLKKGLTATDGAIEGINVYKDLKTISLESSVLGTTDIKLISSAYEFDRYNVKEPAKSQAIWTTNKGTATLKQTTEAGFTLSDDGKTLTYTAAKKDATLVTVSGLNKNFDISQDESVITNNGNVITICNAALGTSKVTVKKEKNGEDYTLALGSDVAQKTDNVTGWVVSGTTATYKNYDKEYYSIDEKGAIVYNKPVDHLIKATVSGIKSGSVIDEDAVDGKVITLGSDQLGTSKVTLKDNEGAGYTLALSRKVTKVEVDGEAKWDTPASKTTATLTGNLTEGYALSADKKTITYSTAKKDQKLATVSGLAKGATISNVENNVITLGASELTTSNVTLKVNAGDDYTLAVDYEDTDNKGNIDEDFDYTDTDGKITHVHTNSTKWSTGSTTAKLTGDVTAGYTLSDDAKTITYSKANAKASLATVEGLKSKDINLEEAKAADIKTNTVSLKGEQLSATVKLSGSYKFDVASDYHDGTINGTKSVENITVRGVNVTVNPGQGNDIIDFGSINRTRAQGNTLVYKSGDGNDVVTNFSSESDIVKVTSKGASVSVSASGNDLLLKVDSNTITLKGIASDGSVSVNQNGKTIQYTVKSADLLYDDANNFVTAGAQLSDITDDAFGAYSIGEDLTAQGLKTLTKQSTLVTYGSDKK